MKLRFLIIFVVLLIHSNECKVSSNEEEGITSGDSSTVSTDLKECVQSSECSEHEACIRKQCKSPCSLDVCGYKAECKVKNHNPICNCGDGYIGDPFIECIRKDGTSDPDKSTHRIAPPCGFFSSQREGPDGPVCACLPGFSGSPPNCIPQCRAHADCKSDKVCFSFRCQNICEKFCSVNSNCKIVEHATICECKDGFEGDPYVECKKILV